MLIQQKQIAEKAGVSYATVSRAFTNSAKVCPQTLQRIRNAMTELGITNADSLFLGKSFLIKTVLVVVGDLASEFYASIIKGIYAVLEPMGYMVVLCNSNYDSETEIRAMRRAEDNGFSGVIMITAVETEALVDYLHTTKLPVLFVNRTIRSVDLDMVRIDNYRGGYMAAEYLLQKGHRRIAHAAGDADSAVCRDRVRGFRDAMADYHIPFGEEDLYYCGQLRSGGRHFIKPLLQEDSPYTAVFFSNTVIAQGALEVISQSGQQIPQTLSVLCFDDSPALDEDGLNLTTLSYDPISMGKTAADVYLKRLADPVGDRIKLSFSPRFRERGSVAEVK